MGLCVGLDNADNLQKCTHFPVYDISFVEKIEYESKMDNQKQLTPRIFA